MDTAAIRQDGVACLRGFGQVMLQESALTGLLFLAGLFTASPWMALGGLVGALSGQFTAKAAGFAREDIARGLYGFNGALVGLAMLCFYRQGIGSWSLAVAGGALSTLLMRAMLRWMPALPPFTAPFVLTTWGLMALAGLLGLAKAAPAAALGAPSPFFAVLRGLGQVMFQQPWIAGALFALGLLSHARHAAAWGLMGSALGWVTAQALGYPEAMAAAGLFGFNGALVGIALGPAFKQDALVPLVGIVLSTVVLRGCQIAEIPGMTAPFVVTSWAMGWVGRRAARFA